MSGAVVSIAPDLEAAALARGYFGIDVPFMSHIGLEPVSLEPGLARTRLPMRPHLANSRGHGHGGALMSALDFTLSAAARSSDPLGLGVVTIEKSTHFQASATTDLLIEARVLRAGARTVFCEGDVLDSAGRAVCTARAVFKLIAL
jgi:uncharacterized protein (TIGR00369 family)